jgi:plastocyanin
MSRMLGLGAAIAVAAVSLVLIGSAMAAPKTVVGTVGPGFTIGLKLDGKKVTKLKAGVPYRLQIKDQSSAHDFHLQGPGLNRVITGVGFTGSKSMVLTFKKGTYKFVCDPHSSAMHGSFTVA